MVKCEEEQSGSECQMPHSVRRDRPSTLYTKELVEDFKESSPWGLGSGVKGSKEIILEKFGGEETKEDGISLAEGAGVQGRSSLCKTGRT